MPHNHRNNLFKLENKCSEQFATSGDESHRYKMMKIMSHLGGWVGIKCSEQFVGGG